MQCNVYVDRDQLGAFEDESEALEFIRRQFDDSTIGEVWLEIGDGEAAKILHGDELVRRVRRSTGPGRLSA